MTVLTALTAAEREARQARFAVRRVETDFDSDPHFYVEAESAPPLIAEVYEEADAALIALARNHLPALLAVARAAEEARDDLREHVGDVDCAGPHGTPRRGACQECRVAELLTAALAPLLGEVTR